MLTRDEWNYTAERAAAAKWGEEHKSWFVFRRFGLPVLAVLVPVGLIGFLAWRTWVAVSGSLSGAGSAPGGLFWVAGAVLVLTTALVFRPRMVPATTHSLMAKGGALVLAWLGFIAYGIGMLIS